jgi:hypothetical protein
MQQQQNYNDLLSKMFGGPQNYRLMGSKDTIDMGSERLPIIDIFLPTNDLCGSRGTCPHFMPTHGATQGRREQPFHFDMKSAMDKIPEFPHPPSFPTVPVPVPVPVKESDYASRESERLSKKPKVIRSINNSGPSSRSGKRGGKNSRDKSKERSILRAKRQAPATSAPSSYLKNPFGDDQNDGQDDEKYNYPASMLTSLPMPTPPMMPASHMYNFPSSSNPYTGVNVNRSSPKMPTIPYSSSSSMTRANPTKTFMVNVYNNASKHTFTVVAFLPGVTNINSISTSLLQKDEESYILDIIATTSFDDRSLGNLIASELNANGVTMFRQIDLTMNRKPEDKIDASFNNGVLVIEIYYSPPVSYSAIPITITSVNNAATAPCKPPSLTPSFSDCRRLLNMPTIPPVPLPSFQNIDTNNLKKPTTIHSANEDEEEEEDVDTITNVTQESKTSINQ